MDWIIQPARYWRPILSQNYRALMAGFSDLWPYHTIRTVTDRLSTDLASAL